MTRRGLAWGGVAAVAGSAAWRKWSARPASPDQGLPWPLRKVLEVDEQAGPAPLSFGKALEARLPVFARPRGPGCPGSTARMGSTRGSTSDDVAAPGRRARRVEVLQPSASHQGVSPAFEVTTELKCIEGWSRGRHLGRGRLADLAEASRAWPPGAGSRANRKRDPATSSPSPAWSTPGRKLLRRPRHRHRRSIPRPSSATR